MNAFNINSFIQKEKKTEVEPEENVAENEAETRDKMYNEVIRTEVINQRLEKSIQTEVINQRSEKSIQTEVINQRSEKSIQTEVRSCHKDKNQSCRSQNEDGEIYNQTEHRSLLFTFSPLLFTFLQLLLNFTVQVYVSLGQYFYLLLRQYLEVSMEAINKVRISDAAIRN